MKKSYTNAQTLTFDQVYEASINNNLDLEKKRIQIDISKNECLKSKYFDLPKISFGFNNSVLWGRFVDPFTYNYNIGRLFTNSVVLNGSLTLFNGRKNSYERGIIGINYQVSKLAIEVAKIQLKKDILNEFILYSMNEELSEVINYQIEYTNQEILITQNLVNAGVFTESKLLEFIAIQNSQTYLLEEISSNKKRAVLRLSIISGLNINDTSKLAVIKKVPDTINFEFLNLNSAYENIINKDYEYQMSKYNISKANMEVKKANANTLPSIFLNSSIYTGYSSRRYNTSNPQNITVVPYFEQYYKNFNQSVTLSLGIPIISGLENHYKRESLVLERKSAEIDHQLIEEKKKQELKELLLECELSKQSYLATLQKYNECNIIFKEHSDKYIYGRLKMSEYFISRQNFYLSKLEVIKKKYSLIQNYNLLKIFLDQDLVLY